MAETPESCTHAINEPCKLHPVDCPRCVNADKCGQKEEVQKYPDQIKRCKFFRAKGQVKL
jgi:hypothetical protein